MSPERSRIDLLLQYALLVAGEEDEYFDRQLGPIHLIKYVYLADLAFASRNDGRIFTGVVWQFYKFGPWSQTVNERIEPALLAIGADRKTFPSDYGEKDEWVRWTLRNDHLLEEKERLIPPAITLRLRADIRKFRKDTPSLLEYVYLTAPMLTAAPNEYLDFSVAATSAAERSTEKLRIETLSAKKQTKFKECMQSLQQKYKASRPNKSVLVNPVKNPRYDSVYEDGIAWLNELAGEEIAPGEKIAEFSDDVWKSSTRKGGDVS